MTVDIEYENQQNKGCIKCPQLTVVRSRITWGYGNAESRIMFIGEAPGFKGCNRTGIAFRGDRSGDLFEKMLASIGYLIEDVYVTNIVKCCPNTNGKNRTPAKEEIENCFNYLINEVLYVKPKLIVCVGKTAAQHVMGDDKLTILGMAGYTLYCERFKTNAFFMPHPAYVLRNVAYMKKYEEIWEYLKLKVDYIIKENGIEHKRIRQNPKVL